MSEPAAVAGGAEPGTDGLLRCPWALGTADYRAYHDQEWGRPVRSDAGIFERLSLEAFAARWSAGGPAVAFFDPGIWDSWRRRGLPGRVLAADTYTIAVSR